MQLMICDYSYKETAGSWFAERVKPTLSCDCKIRGSRYADTLLLRPIPKLWNIPHIFLWKVNLAFENCEVSQKLREGSWVIPDNYFFVVVQTEKDWLDVKRVRMFSEDKYRKILKNPKGQPEDTLFEEHFYFVNTQDPQDPDLIKLMKKLEDWRELS